MIHFFKYQAEVYYIKRDTLKLTCDISKEAHYGVWWKIAQQYFFYNTSTEHLYEMETQSRDTALVEDALTSPVEEWSVEEIADEDITKGYHTQQVLLFILRILNDIPFQTTQYTLIEIT